MAHDHHTYVNEMMVSISTGQIRNMKEYRFMDFTRLKTIPHFNYT